MNTKQLQAGFYSRRGYETLRFEVPGIDRKDDAIEYINEFYEHNSDINGAGGLHRYLDNYQEWLDLLEEKANMKPNEEKVPSRTFFLVRERDNRIVGMSNIRLALNDKLKEYGGHIGYAIRPTERGKGYNNINLYLALKVCDKHGIDLVFMDADLDNPASWKTMEAFGGKRVREYFDHHEANCMVVDYNIDVKKALTTCSFEKGIVEGDGLSDRAKEIVSRHSKPANVLEDAKTFLYEMLEPAPGREDMLYRYEHCIRVAENAKMLVKAEGLPEEPFVMACLLHDVGYRESDNYGGFNVHAYVSAQIVKAYLEAIDYDPQYRDEIYMGVKRHDLSDKLPEDMTVFQISVRDCDDIDRFDMIRTAMVLGDCTNEKTNSEIIESCEKEIDKANWRISLRRGTKTADKVFVAQLEKRIALLQEVIEHARKGF
ncbi:GNAT family N-acetyltransferase [Butyrivibrio sp. INlla14]|uniref:GNAT family N-acetyltransferase n=1 Tax=Butyrivibrio sp. INlla14 TaxID=1520808 RepID=UPI0008768868|nr:GNAT family N-acetyltransferase [Butyrivibrio sp. INlla14]SCY75342.1 HDIG domain-containing protein [Butyrivibrio sp. INlla14]